MNDRMFRVSGSHYDRFMGRWSRQLAPSVAEAGGIAAGHRVLDVGCGPGALTGVLVDLVGPSSVAACDPSETFVAACAGRHPGVDVRQAGAEQLPWPDRAFNAVLAQLVLNFVPDRATAATEMMRVLRPGGTVATAVWDYGEGMEMLRRFWDAARAIRTDAPDEAHPAALGGVGELAGFLTAAGFETVAEGTLRVESTYDDAGEVWQGFLLGVGPAGTWCLSLTEDEREALRREFLGRLPDSGPVTLTAVARCGTGVRPSP
ncbi:MAG: class I SAM-dependent methyltransferase [Nocardioides sp.]